MAEFLSLNEAVKKNLNEGEAVCFEGFTHLIPHAAAHEVIRQRIKDLTIIRMTPDVMKISAASNPSMAATASDVK